MYGILSLSYAVDDLEVPIVSEEHDIVDMDLFWEQMELSLIARGLVKGSSLSCFPKVRELYHYGAISPMIFK